VIADGTPDELKAQVGGERLEIRLDNRARGEDAVAALAGLVCGTPVLEDGAVLVQLRERNGAIAESVRRLDEAGLGIEDIALRRPTLDDVFLQLTGHATEPGDEEEQDR
jgi:ABC-2 type transport system ATP-binding protein